MPYVSCQRCGVTVYSAARFSGVDECPGCGAALGSGPKWFESSQSTDRLLACDPESVGAARDAVDKLSARLQPDLLADLRLLVSELVTNSVEHGPRKSGKPIGLRLSISNASVRAEVRDGGCGFTPPSPSPSSLDAVSGRGLYLVDQLADRWGVTDGPNTSVWVELDRARLDAKHALPTESAA